MTQAKQDADERRWITAMVELLGIELRGEPEKQDALTRRPDFLLTLADGKRVAVEVTEAMDEAVRNGYDGSLGLVARLVEQGMKVRGLTANVCLIISRGTVAMLAKLPGKSRHAISARIVDLVGEARGTPLAAEHIGLLYQDGPNEPIKHGMQYIGDLSSRGITCLEGIFVYPCPEVVVLTVAAEARPGPEHIQEAIDRKVAKAAKSQGYNLRGVDEFWLLVAGSTGTVGDFDADVAKGRTFTSPFDRTIFLEWSERKCVELDTRHAT